MPLNSTHVVIFQIRELKQIRCYGKSFLSDMETGNFLKLNRKEALNYLLVFPKKIGIRNYKQEMIFSRKSYMRGFMLNERIFS